MGANQTHYEKNKTDTPIQEVSVYYKLYKGCHAFIHVQAVP
jgi:hypothetical protein